VFADGEVAVNVAGCVALLRDLDVAGDYPGFVVDEVLGRELAATIAGGAPSLLAQATFHFVDVHVSEDATADGAGAAGADDLDAALAAGFQTRLPGGTGGREKARSRWRHRLTSSAGSAAAEQRSARELPDEVVSGIEDCVGEEPCKHADPGGGAGLDAGRWLRCARGVDDRVGDDFGLDRAGTVTPSSWVSSKIS